MGKINDNIILLAENATSFRQIIYVSHYILTGIWVMVIF